VFEKLDNPKSIKDTAWTWKILKNVYLCSPTDNIKIVLKDMKENLYTHVPVYDWENYIWTISESSIAYWLSDHIDEDNNIIFENITVNDVVNYSKWNDWVVFIWQHYPLHELEYVFYKALENWERVWIILITNLGKIDEKPIGIVTARDLPRIKDLL
jgi:CBS domain-containing protein